MALTAALFLLSPDELSRIAIPAALTARNVISVFGIEVEVVESSSWCRPKMQMLLVLYPPLGSKQ